MSGYLEVKYPFRSNLGLNPFKSWKRQWCILRPSPTCSGGGSLAVYCSEAGAPAGTVELPLGCVVRRAKSRTRPHAFAVFSVDEPRKPRILLAAQSLNDANIWMEKIRSLLTSTKLLGSESSLKDTYSVTIVTTDLSRKCGLNSDSNLTLSASGLLVSRGPKLGTVLDWKHISDVLLVSENADKSRTCVLIVDSEFPNGPGELKFSSPLASELVTALRQCLADGTRPSGNKLSRSEGDLRKNQDNTSEVRRSSWYSGPSEVSLDDIDLVMSKESKRIPCGALSRCAARALDEPDAARSGTLPRSATKRITLDDSMSDRRSLLSVASGIYEEIPDIPHPPVTPTPTTVIPTTTTVPTTTTTTVVPTELDTQYCAMSRPLGIAGLPVPEEPAYESVSECVYATMRRARRPPPPLPPRLPFGSSKLGESWNSRINSPNEPPRTTRHGSLGSLPRCCTMSSESKTLPKFDKTKQPFSVFRKRLKSDSRLISSPKSETAKENKDVETKKKRFEFTPTRDIFKSFKVGRKMKNLKITGALAKGETKSCEFLDESEHVAPNRCSKSVECLEDTDDLDTIDADLSITLDPSLLPHEILQLLLRRDFPEGEYLPMSPGVAPQTDHYMVMSPRNVAGV